MLVTAVRDVIFREDECGDWGHGPASDCRSHDWQSESWVECEVVTKLEIEEQPGINILVSKG